MNTPLRYLTLLLGGIILSAAPALGQVPESADPSEMSGEELREYRESVLDNWNRRRISTTRADAKFLRILVKARKATRGIEVGSFRGHGAAHMGMGFEATGGKLFTIEIDSRRAQATRKNIEKLGLGESVDCIEGDALKVLPELEGEFDFLFLDAKKSDYIDYFRAVEERLKPGAVIVADNAIRFGDAMQDFLDLLRDDPQYDMEIVQASEKKQDGMAVAVKSW